MTTRFSQRRRYTSPVLGKYLLDSSALTVLHLPARAEKATASLGESGVTGGAS